MSLKIGAAYIRVSTDDQLEYSPDSQLSVIREYAQRDGYVIPDEFVFREDDGISGKRADKRPAFRLMIATAKDGKTPPFDAIFVWKFSRFARNQEESVMYKGLLRRRGIDVRSVSEPADGSPWSSLIERIIEWMDEYYLINLAGEVRRGMAEKAARGEAMGTAPFGYTVKNKIFTPNENAETVRYIFERFAAGAGARSLARELGDRGVRTRRGNLPDNRWVRYILGNPVYIGKVRWSREGHANYGRADYNGDHVMLVDGKHPPIIDKALWDRAQQRLAERSTETKYVRRSSRSKMYMLKGLLRCGDCGSTLVYTSTATPTLQCHKYAKGQCHVSHSIAVSKANAAVISYLREVVETGAFTFSPEPAAPAKLSRDWDALITSEQARLRRARSALLDGAFSSDEYKAAKEEIERSIEKLTAARDAEQLPPAAAPDPDAFRKKVRAVLEIIESPDVDEAAKNQFLRSILEKIVYNKPDGSFDFYFTL